MNNELLQYLRNQVNANSTVLDLGCGKRDYHDLGCLKVVGVDAWEKVNPDILLDLEKEDLTFAENSFNMVMMIDFIEHLSKERGLEIIEQAKKIASERVILMTPSFWTDNRDNTNNSSLWCYGNEHNNHKSLWKRSDFVGWNFVDNVMSLDYIICKWVK